MNRRWLVGEAFTVLALAALCPRQASALTLNFGAVEPEQTQIVELSDGLENAFAATVGYGRLVRGAGWLSLVGADLTMVMVDAADYRLRVGASAPIIRGGPWMITARLFPLVRGSQNQLGRMTNLGVEAGLGGGFFGRHWFGAVDLGVDWAAATYVANSDRYRTTVYADAKDGWYASTGTRLLYGLFGGYSWRSVDLVLRAGQARDLNLGVWYIPFYATAGINLRWR